MKRYFSLILAIAATVSAQIVPSTGNVRGPTSATDNAVARYDGTTGKLVQNSAVTIDDSGNTTAADVILGTSGPSVKSSLSARAPRQGLVMDGSTTPYLNSLVAGPNNSDFTVAFWLNPTSFASSQYLLGNSQANSFYIGIRNNTGAVFSGKASVSGFADTNFSLTAGKTQLLVRVKNGSSVTFYLDGVAVQSGITDNNSYPGSFEYIGGADATQVRFTGFIAPLIYNRALSASEVVSLYEAGAPAGADYVASGQTAGTSVVGTSFASGWSTDGGFTAGTNAVFTSTGNAYKLGVLTSGKRYRLSVEIVSADAGAVLTYYNGSSYVSMSTAGSTGVKTVEFTASGTNFVVAPVVGSGGLTLTAPSVNPIGLLLAPDAQQVGNGYVWNDQSGNLAQIVLPSSGVQWNLPSVAGQRIRGTTSTNGNQQLLGASVLLPAECQITHVRARARSGTPTITIGTASGGAQIVASVALSTTWLNCTIALTGGIVSSADDIWVGSNSTDVVEIDIAYQPLKL